METTINLPPADQVLELIREFRAARDAGRHASPVAQCDPPNSDAPWPPLLLAIGLLSAGVLATDLLYPFVSGPTAFSKPTFAVFSSVALAGRLAGARGAWYAVLFAWPAEVVRAHERRPARARPSQRHPACRCGCCRLLYPLGVVALDRALGSSASGVGSSCAFIRAAPVASVAAFFGDRRATGGRLVRVPVMSPRRRSSTRSRAACKPPRG